MELVRIILSSVKEDIPINALPLSQGFLIGSSQFMIEGLKDSGQISDREYGKILKRYMELMDKPTERKVEKYIEEANKLLLSNMLGG